MLKKYRKFSHEIYSLFFLAENKSLHFAWLSFRYVENA